MGAILASRKPARSTVLSRGTGASPYISPISKEIRYHQDVSKGIKDSAKDYKEWKESLRHDEAVARLQALLTEETAGKFAPSTDVQHLSRVYMASDPSLTGSEALRKATRTLPQHPVSRDYRNALLQKNALATSYAQATGLPYHQIKKMDQRSIRRHYAHHLQEPQPTELPRYKLPWDEYYASVTKEANTINSRIQQIQNMYNMQKDLTQSYKPWTAYTRGVSHDQKPNLLLPTREDTLLGITSIPRPLARQPQKDSQGYHDFGQTGRGKELYWTGKGFIDIPTSIAKGYKKQARQLFEDQRVNYGSIVGGLQLHHRASHRDSLAIRELARREKEYREHLIRQGKNKYDPDIHAATSTTILLGTTPLTIPLLSLLPPTLGTVLGVAPPLAMAFSTAKRTHTAPTIQKRYEGLGQTLFHAATAGVGLYGNSSHKPTSKKHQTPTSTTSKTRPTPRLYTGRSALQSIYDPFKKGYVPYWFPKTQQRVKDIFPHIYRTHSQPTKLLSLTTHKTPPQKIASLKVIPTIRKKLAQLTLKHTKPQPAVTLKYSQHHPFPLSRLRILFKKHKPRTLTRLGSSYRKLPPSEKLRLSLLYRSLPPHVLSRIRFFLKPSEATQLLRLRSTSPYPTYKGTISLPSISLKHTPSKRILTLRTGTSPQLYQGILSAPKLPKFPLHQLSLLRKLRIWKRSQRDKFYNAMAPYINISPKLQQSKPSYHTLKHLKDLDLRYFLTKNKAWETNYKKTLIQQRKHRRDTHRLQKKIRRRLRIEQRNKVDRNTPVSLRNFDDLPWKHYLYNRDRQLKLNLLLEKLQRKQQLHQTHLNRRDFNALKHLRKHIMRQPGQHRRTAYHTLQHFDNLSLKQQLAPGLSQIKSMILNKRSTLARYRKALQKRRARHKRLKTVTTPGPPGDLRTLQRLTQAERLNYLKKLSRVSREAFISDRNKRIQAHKLFKQQQKTLRKQALTEDFSLPSYDQLRHFDSLSRRISLAQERQHHRKVLQQALLKLRKQKIESHASKQRLKNIRRSAGSTPPSRPVILRFLEDNRWIHLTDKLKGKQSTIYINRKGKPFVTHEKNIPPLQKKPQPFAKQKPQQNHKKTSREQTHETTSKDTVLTLVKPKKKISTRRHYRVRKKPPSLSPKKRPFERLSHLKPVLKTKSLRKSRFGLLIPTQKVYDFPSTQPFTSTLPRIRPKDTQSTLPATDTRFHYNQRLKLQQSQAIKDTRTISALLTQQKKKSPPLFHFSHTTGYPGIITPKKKQTTGMAYLATYPSGRTSKPFRTKKEAIAEGMDVTDEAPWADFTIGKTPVDPKLKAALSKRSKRSTKYKKYNRYGNTFSEKSRYQRDSKTEMNWMKMLRR